LTWAMLSQLPVCQLAAQLAVPATPSRKLPARVALARKPMSHTAYARRCFAAQRQNVSAANLQNDKAILEGNESARPKRGHRRSLGRCW